MMRVIEEVEKIKLGEHPLLGSAIFALTDIISEPYPGYSVIPSRCKATYDRRLLTGETVDDVLGVIQSLPAIKNIPFKAVIADGKHEAYTGKTLTCTKFFPAWEMEVKHPFVQAALRERFLSQHVANFSIRRMLAI